MPGRDAYLDGLLEHAFTAPSIIRHYLALFGATPLGACHPSIRAQQKRKWVFGKKGRRDWVSASSESRQNPMLGR